MSNNWYFSFDNAPLSASLQNKLQQCGILKDVPDTYLPNEPETRFIKDFFTPDGFPKIETGLKHSEVAYPYIFPAIAPWYDGAAIPSVIVDMDPLYRQTACEAALSWLFNLTSAADSSCSVADCSRTFHGLAFQEEINGTNHTFAFPDTRISTSSHGTAAVVLCADSYWNTDDWAKQGSVPLYARQQAMFQLWCWNKFAEKSGYAVDPINVAFIVRICGNLAVDCTIRTIFYNDNEAGALIRRICKARDMEAQRGLYWKRNAVNAQTWMEKLNDEAFHTDSADLHDLIVQYMKARSDRKQIERVLMEVENKMEAIAVELASHIPAGDIQGTYDLPDGSVCTVTHQHKRSHRSIPTISPDMVRSFFPNLDACISPSGSVRTRVTIEAL